MLEDDFFQREGWYDDAKTYWKTIEPTVNGMLGGLESVHPADIAFSKDFTDRLFNEHGKPKNKSGFHVCDCGAGIGRVSKNLLVPLFASVDLVESNPVFIAQAKESFKAEEKVKDFFTCGLEDFDPVSLKREYHIIWAQWVLGHLTDKDLVKFMKRCLKNVSMNDGYLIIKENVSKFDDYVLDDEDSSVTRSNKVWEKLFHEAGAKIVKHEKQPNFPAHLFPVYLWALKSTS